MAESFVVGPSVGIARLGNHPDSFYLEPEEIGGLPRECDERGNALQTSTSVRQFKKAGMVRRQAARFRLFRTSDDGSEREVTLEDADVMSIRWTVHLANKKAVWFTFAELDGNLLYGAANSYEARRVALRNKGVKGHDARRKLIIDPGPRTVTGRNDRASFEAAQVPNGYAFASFPTPPKLGERVATLGEIRTDDVGRLLVLGGLGKSGGDEVIGSFAGADTWHDDISDGPVRCDLTLKSGESLQLRAWCIVGSPKYAPEIINIVTLDDTMYDIAIRHMAVAPAIFSDGGFRDDYVANFDRDIRPILERPAAYRWVAATPSLNSASPPPFDARDPGPKTAALRQAYLRLFRDPGGEDTVGLEHQTLFSPDGFPMLPLNSGSNSVSDHGIDKFLTLTETQSFFLKQWADGKFVADPPAEEPAWRALTRASTGNCVGAPFCPGIEVTWTVRNPNLYDAPWSIRHRDPGALYAKQGLDPSRDETAAGDGCEPGDLTKRMAIPWQADFFECSVQSVNFTDPSKNDAPPMFYTYWWPPQSPWQVINGDVTASAQKISKESAGQQVMFSRGVNEFQDMIKLWSYLGFVANQTTGENRNLFPYFTEQERAHDKIAAAQAKPRAAEHELKATVALHINDQRLVGFETSRERGRVPNRE